MVTTAEARRKEHLKAPITYYPCMVLCKSLQPLPISFHVSSMEPDLPVNFKVILSSAPGFLSSFTVFIWKLAAFSLFFNPVIVSDNMNQSSIKGLHRRHLSEFYFYTNIKRELREEPVLCLHITGNLGILLLTYYQPVVTTRSISLLESPKYNI